MKQGGIDATLNVEGVKSASRGLVGDTVFSVIPNVKPIHTFAITIGLQSASVVDLSVGLPLFTYLADFSC